MGVLFARSKESMFILTHANCKINSASSICTNIEIPKLRTFTATQDANLGEVNENFGVMLYIFGRSQGSRVWEALIYMLYILE